MGTRLRGCGPVSDWSDSSEWPLVEAIASLDNVDPESVAGLLDDRLDAAVSSRSSHDDPDPNDQIGANLDAAVSSRSSHDDPDPNGRIGTNLDAAVSTRATPADSIDWASKTAMADTSYQTNLSISGSGFIVAIGLAVYSDGSSSYWTTPDVSLTIDGTDLGTVLQMSVNTNGGPDGGAASMPLMARFEQGATIRPANKQAQGGYLVVNYVLD